MLQNHDIDFTLLAKNIKCWGKSIGFQDVKVTSCDVTRALPHLKHWLNKNFHGEMQYMANNIDKRSEPSLLHPKTIRVISVRLDYLPNNDNSNALLANKQKAFVARYALGRDYHKVIKKKLNTLAKRINEHVDLHDYRAFTDSAPVLERALAENAGLGWIGKNTMLINRNAGSYFCLGELFTNLPLPVDEPTTAHCGSCRACIDVCPTQAIVAPYQLDARRCISYLTIENKGPIPKDLRPLMGNRVFGCDDCQLICPWNKFAKPTNEMDFIPRHNLNTQNLVDLFLWDEDTFLKKTEGSAIRRATYIGWLRNIAVALGNATTSPAIINALRQKQNHDNDMLREHVQWAIEQHV